MSAPDVSRLVVVSNRLPVVLSEGPGGWEARPGAGGLISALAPALRNRGGTWIGWPGTAQVDEVRETLAASASGTGYSLEPVEIPDTILQGFYYGFANEVIWPLFHDLPTRCNFQPSYWHDYLEANRRFACAVARHTSEHDYVWVHDYQLMNVAAELNSLGARRRTGFFLHIPFPAPDMFLKLPWRFQVLRALLEYDTIGFQTVRDTRNFIACLRTLVTGIHVRGRGHSSVVELPGREATVSTFPIGIDFEAFDRGARAENVVSLMMQARDRLPNTHVILGIDRLDYTKGLPQRIHAVADAVRRYPDLHGNLTLVQVVVPSREDVPEYQEQRRDIERLVGEVNGELSLPGWVPVQYLYRSLTQEELYAYYRMAEVCLVTPLKDGMNLVSKEYCACNVDGDGSLVLSEFAGSAAQLRGDALLVNPYDVEGTADAIHTAIRMPRTERRARMRRLRASIRREDIRWWTDSFLRAAISKRLDDFPETEYFVPQTHLGTQDADAPPE